MRTGFSLLVSTAVLLFGSGAAAAQTRAFVAGGAVIPTGDLGSLADPGPAIAVGVLLEPRAGGLAMGVEASYGRAGHSSANARSDLYELMGLVAYTVGALGPVEWAPRVGVGALLHARRSSDFPGLDATRAGVGAKFGLRATFPIGSVYAFAEGSYVLGFGEGNTAAFPTEFLSVMAGLTIPLGS